MPFFKKKVDDQSFGDIKQNLADARVVTVNLEYLKQKFKHVAGRYYGLKEAMIPIYAIYNDPVYDSVFTIIILSIGNCLGFDAMWRFPYLCFKYGGGPFVIAYVIIMLLVGLPLFLIEAGLGRYSNQGFLTCWTFAPLFKFIGVGMAFVTTILCIYYPVLISWSLYFLVDSMESPLPWENCNKKYCNMKSRQYTYISNCTLDTTQKIRRGLCIGRNNDVVGWGEEKYVNQSYFGEEYFNEVVLDINPRIVNKPLGFEGFHIRFLLNLLFVWVVTFCVVIRKRPYPAFLKRTAEIIPLIVFVLLFTVGFEEGFKAGWQTFVSLNGTTFKDPNMWRDAAVQVILSLKLATGSIITFASYNTLHDNLIRDAFVVVFFTCLFNLLSGLLTFGYLGVLANRAHIPIDLAIEKGISMVFVVFPQVIGINELSGSFWCILYFFSFTLVGINALVSMISTFLMAICDNNPKYAGNRPIFLFLLCLLFFGSGVVFSTRSAVYLVSYIDTYSFGWNMMIILVFELFATVVIYGGCDFAMHIEELSSFAHIGCKCISWNVIVIFWLITWYGLAPITLLGILIVSCIFVKPLSYNYDEISLSKGIFPFLGIFAMLFIILVCMLVKLIKFAISKNENKALLFSKIKWGIPLEEVHQYMKIADGACVDPRNDTDMTKDDWDAIHGLLEKETHSKVKIDT